MLTALLRGMFINVILLLLLLIYIELRCHLGEGPQKILYRYLSTLLILPESTKDFNNSDFFFENLPFIVASFYGWVTRSGH
jgi:hypothetical protein